MLRGIIVYLVILNDSQEEVRSRGGLLEVVNSNVNSLGDDSVSDLLIDDNTNGAGVDVEDATSFTMVVLVGHTLVDGTINHNIDDFTDLVSCEGSGDVDGTCLFESLSELVSGLSSVAV